MAGKPILTHEHSFINLSLLLGESCYEFHVNLIENLAWKNNQYRSTNSERNTHQNRRTILIKTKRLGHRAQDIEHHTRERQQSTNLSNKRQTVENAKQLIKTTQAVLIPAMKEYAKRIFLHPKKRNSRTTKKPTTKTNHVSHLPTLDGNRIPQVQRHNARNGNSETQEHQLHANLHQP
jgi:hypothetical protein